MFEKIFGKKKSIKRVLILNLILSVAIVFVISLIGLLIFVNKESLNRLILLNLATGDNLRDLTYIFQRFVIMLILNTVLISALVISVISRKIIKPIENLSNATKKVAEGNFDVNINPIRDDEIGELTKNFNDMVKELSEVEILQKDFIDNVSHEIKTPISSIQGFAKLLDDDNITKEERKEYVGIITEEVDRLLNLSNKVLRLSKLQNQDKIEKKENINITEQIRRIIALLEPKSRKKNISFNLNDIENDVFYLGDEELTYQIWVNLIDNAIKFSKENGIIDIEIKKVENKVTVKIKDHGIGMSEDEVKKIYTRFYQTDRSHSQEGSGLGLSIVKRIVDLSNGEIKVESQKEKGTCFTIIL